MGLPGHRRPVGDAVGAWVYRWWCISAMTGAQDAQVTARVGYSRREPTPTNGAVTWVSSSKCDVHTPAPQVVHTPTAAEARLSVEQSKQFIMYSFNGWVNRRQKSQRSIKRSDPKSLAGRSAEEMPTSQRFSYGCEP